VLPYTYKTPPVADAETAPDDCICMGSSICTSQTAAPLLSGVVRNARRETVALTSADDFRKFKFTAIPSVLGLVLAVPTYTDERMVSFTRLLPVGPL